MDLPALWREHQHAMFPPSAIAVAGLLQLDAEAGALLTASLRRDGLPRPLSAEKRAELSACRERIARALAGADLDAETRAYFGRLDALAEAVLRG